MIRSLSLIFSLALIACNGAAQCENDCSGQSGSEIDTAAACPEDCSDTDDTGTQPVEDGFLEVVYTFEGDPVTTSVINTKNDKVLGVTNTPIQLPPGSYDLRFGDPKGVFSDDGYPTQLIDDGTWDGWRVISPEKEITVESGKSVTLDAEANAFASGEWSCVNDLEDESPQTLDAEYLEGHLLDLPSTSQYTMGGIDLAYSDEDCNNLGIFLMAEQIFIEVDCDVFNIEIYCWAGNKDDKPSVWE